MTYLDTNILIYLLEGHKLYGRQIAEALEKLTKPKGELATSTITITEFLASTGSSNKEMLEQLPKLHFIPVDEVLAEKAAALKRTHRTLQIGDTIHLATAIQVSELFFSNDLELSKIAAKFIAVKGLEEK